MDSADVSGVVGAVSCRAGGDNGWLVMIRCTIGIILLVGLVLRVAFLIVNLEFATLPQGGHDAIEFERLAWEHASNGLKPLSDYLLDSAHFMVLPGALIYSVTGRAPYVLGLIMVFLGVGVIYLTYRASLELWEDERMSRMIAWAAALFPQLVLHSALFLREIPVSFCLAAAALCAVRFVRRNNVVYALWFSLWAVVGTLFHSGVIFAIPALLLGTMLVRPQGNRSKVKFYAVNAAAALVLVGAIYAVNETGTASVSSGVRSTMPWRSLSNRSRRVP